MTLARLLLPAVLLIAGPAAAETQYITDQLSVTLRASPVGDARAVGAPLTSGNPVDVLQRSPDGKWVRVRFQQVDGWLPASQLQATQGARDRLQELQGRLDAANRELRSTQEQLQAAKSDIQAADTALALARTERDAALQQLGDLRIGAAGPQQISAANQTLNQRITELKIDNEKLAAEAARLADDQRADFLLYGALIVFGGMLAGWLTARQSGRRSSGW